MVLIAGAIFLLIVALATLTFSAFYEAEEWSALDAFYFTIVTFTTIGFGDFSPDPHPTWFASIFIAFTFLGLGITATLVRAASDRDFDSAATARGLAPNTVEAFVGAWQRVQTVSVDAIGLPRTWRPIAHPVVSQCAVSQLGFADAVASIESTTSDAADAPAGEGGETKRRAGVPRVTWGAAPDCAGVQIQASMASPSTMSPQAQRRGDVV